VSVIDADTHVIECEDTWEYMGAAQRELIQRVTIHDAKGHDRHGWVLDGRLVSGAVVDEAATSSAVRELRDVQGRLHQMDELRTDVQVLYPTIFLFPLTEDPALEVALCRSYNRWVADRVADGHGRLSWVVVPPTLAIDSAIEEIRFGWEHGAGGVFWRGFEHGMLPEDPYFVPLLEEMDRLGLPMCIHAANGTPELVEAFPSYIGIWRFKIPGITAFHSILLSDLALRFPTLRFGFIELQAQWVPYVLKDYVRRVQKDVDPGRSHHRGSGVDPGRLMSERRMFVGCQTDDDIPYLLRYAGRHNLVAGSDFGHVDTSSELLALQQLQRLEDLDTDAVDRILDANPRALYRLEKG
jgi:predicted TIM-barrel fold metal-dependent hydrolase